jgi:gamma-glutamyltranspeptidase/glutathione hydrolase
MLTVKKPTVRCSESRRPATVAPVLFVIIPLVLAANWAATDPGPRPTPPAPAAPGRAARPNRAAGAATQAAATPTPTPEAAKELPDQIKTSPVASSAGMVVSGSAEASRVGMEVLAEGGNAVDAAVAAAFALGVAEPTLCGLGGQTYMLIRLSGGRDIAIDGSVTVPLQASPGQMARLNEEKDRSGHELVATPGTLAALTVALHRYGTRSLADELAPAIDLARFGVAMGAEQRAIFARFWRRLWEWDYLPGLFYRDFIDVWEPEHLYCQPELANTMTRIAEHGAADFYRGRIADEIDADMRKNGGSLRKADLVSLWPIEKRPCRGSYRGYEVVSFPSPGGGAILLEALQIIESFPQELLRADSTDRLQLLIDAVRIAELDYRSSRLPTTLLDHTLTDKQHARDRASLIRFDRALRDNEIVSRVPPMWQERGTTHLSVADSAGNIVSLTQTLGGPFGAGVADPKIGFVYNNMLLNFQYQDPTSQGYLRPRERPLTTMVPTIVSHDGRPFLVTGSAGSGRIVSAVILAISNVIDRDLPLGKAMEVPRVLWEGGDKRQVYLEMVNPVTNAQADELERRGYSDMKRLYFPARLIDLVYYGSLNAIEVQPGNGTFVGVGDPHRCGFAVGVPPTGSDRTAAAVHP